MQIFDSDFSYLEGTNCYCCDEAASEIRHLLEDAPLDAVHLIGTGDYHYLSLFWLEKIEEDFVLVLIDNHPDDQASAFDGQMLSCGSWVTRARELPHCRADIWVNGDSQFRSEGESCISGLPVYLSIDLDALSEQYARTDWNQGKMSLDELCGILRRYIGSRRILGADICGGITESKGGSAEDMALNEATIATVTAVLQEIP